MLTRVFTKNKDNKIEFTEKELKELLDEIYNYGYKEGKGAKTYVYTSPSWLDIVNKPSWTYTTTPAIVPKYETTCTTSTDTTCATSTNTTTNTEGEDE